MAMSNNRGRGGAPRETGLNVGKMAREEGTSKFFVRRCLIDCVLKRKAAVEPHGLTRRVNKR